MLVGDGGNVGSTPKSRYAFTCAKLPQKEAWADAFEAAVHNTRIHRHSDAGVGGGNKDELFGRARTGDERAKDIHGVQGEKALVGEAASAASQNMGALQERGERLEKLQNKTSNLEQNAADYRDTARQLKEKAKKQSMFGF